MNYILKSLVIVLIFLTSCADKAAINASLNKEIITHALANPTTLNPQCHTSQLADQMVNLMFQPLLVLMDLVVTLQLSMLGMLAIKDLNLNLLMQPIQRKI